MILLPSVYLQNIPFSLLSPYHIFYQQPMHVQCSNHSYTQKTHFWLMPGFLSERLTPRWAQLEILSLLWWLQSLSWWLLLVELLPSATLGTAVTCWATLRYFANTLFNSSLNFNVIICCILYICVHYFFSIYDALCLFSLAPYNFILYIFDIFLLSLMWRQWWNYTNSTWVLSICRETR